MLELSEWLGEIEALADAEIAPASADASFRRYFRCRTATESFIAMDAPPPQEDCQPFIRVAGLLEVMQLNAPRILAADIDRGFLLLTDLGDTQYLRHLKSQPESSADLYDDAINALHVMRESGDVYRSMLPTYDAELLDVELSLFHDWLCGTHCDIWFGPNEEMAWRETCSLLIRNALDQPQVFVHRDYHSRNLMVVPNENPGILDFQDAVDGPLTYDLVSLLKDCYIRWPVDQVQAWSLQYYAGMSEKMRHQLDRDQFVRYFELMGVQRHLKAAGIFARLNHRDGKRGYLDDIPRTLGYVSELQSRYSELGFLIDVIQQRVLPMFESTA